MTKFERAPSGCERCGVYVRNLLFIHVLSGANKRGAAAAGAEIETPRGGERGGDVPSPVDWGKDQLSLFSVAKRT